MLILNSKIVPYVALYVKIKSIKPYQSADGLDPLIGIDPRVEVLTKIPLKKAGLVRLTKKLKLFF